MSGTNQVKIVSLPAGQDLAGDLFEVVKIENDSDVGKVIKASAVTDTVVGIVYESLDAVTGADGERVPVALVAGGGIAQVKAGANITAGDIVVPDTTAGRVASGGANQAALAADVVGIGIALESAVDGDVFNVLLQPIQSSLSGT